MEHFFVLEESQDRVLVHCRTKARRKWVSTSGDLSALVRFARRIDPDAPMVLADNAERFRDRLFAT